MRSQLPSQRAGGLPPRQVEEVKVNRVQPSLAAYTELANGIIDEVDKTNEEVIQNHSKNSSLAELNERIAFNSNNNYRTGDTINETPLKIVGDGSPWVDYPNTSLSPRLQKSDQSYDNMSEVSPDGRHMGAAVRTLMQMQESLYRKQASIKDQTQKDYIRHQTEKHRKKLNEKLNESSISQVELFENLIDSYPLDSQGHRMLTLTTGGEISLFNPGTFEMKQLFTFRNLVRIFDSPDPSEGPYSFENNDIHLRFAFNNDFTQFALACNNKIFVIDLTEPKKQTVGKLVQGRYEIEINDQFLEQYFANLEIFFRTFQIGDLQRKVVMIDEIAKIKKIFINNFGNILILTKGSMYKSRQGFDAFQSAISFNLKEMEQKILKEEGTKQYLRIPLEKLFIVIDLKFKFKKVFYLNKTYIFLQTDTQGGMCYDIFNGESVTFRLPIKIDNEIEQLDHLTSNVQKTKQVPVLKDVLSMFYINEDRLCVQYNDRIEQFIYDKAKKLWSQLRELIVFDSWIKQSLHGMILFKVFKDDFCFFSKEQHCIVVWNKNQQVITHSFKDEGIYSAKYQLYQVPQIIQKLNKQLHIWNHLDKQILFNRITSHSFDFFQGVRYGLYQALDQLSELKNAQKLKKLHEKYREYRYFQYLEDVDLLIISQSDQQTNSYLIGNISNLDSFANISNCLSIEGQILEQMHLESGIMLLMYTDDQILLCRVYFDVNNPIENIDQIRFQKQVIYKSNYALKKLQYCRKSFEVIGTTPDQNEFFVYNILTSEFTTYANKVIFTQRIGQDEPPQEFKILRFDTATPSRPTMQKIIRYQEVMNLRHFTSSFIDYDTQRSKEQYCEKRFVVLQNLTTKQVIIYELNQQEKRQPFQLQDEFNNLGSINFDGGFYFIQIRHQNKLYIIDPETQEIKSGIDFGISSNINMVNDANILKQILIIETRERNVGSRNPLIQLLLMKRFKKDSSDLSNQTFKGHEFEEGHENQLQNLMFIKNAFTMFDREKQILRVYKNFDSYHLKDDSVIFSVTIRVHKVNILDTNFEDQNEKPQLILRLESNKNQQQEFNFKTEQIINFLENNRIEDVLSYNINKQTYLLDNWKKDYSVHEAVIKKIKALRGKEFPLMFIPNATENSIDYCIKMTQTQNLQLIIDFIVSYEENGFIYRSFVQDYISKLMRLGVNMKQYFDSNLALQKIEQLSHDSNSYGMRMFSTEESLIEQIKAVIWKEKQECIEQEDEKNKKLSNILHYLSSIIGLIIFSPIFLPLYLLTYCMSKAKIRKCRKLHDWSFYGLKHIISRNSKLKNKNKNQLTRFDVYIMDIGNSLRKRRKGYAINNPSIGNRSFMQSLQVACYNDITYLEIPLIQYIITFKWQKYTKHFFLKRSIFLLIFMISFILDVGFNHEYGIAKDPEKRRIAIIVTRVLCSLCLAYLGIYEIIQIWYQGIIDYIKSIWNICDVSLISIYYTYVRLSSSEDFDEQTVKTLQILIVFFSFIKLTFYLRVFDGFSFLVRMLQSVFIDLVYFFLLFAMVIAAFTVCLSILVNQDHTQYPGIDIFSFYVMAFRTSVGDYNLDDYVTNSDYKILTWIVWFTIMLIGNVIFMNFIIAVVNSSYVNCMEKMIAQSYRVKLDLIVEREQTLSETQLKDSEWFPSHILMRLPTNIDRESDLKEIKSMLREIQHNNEKQMGKVFESIEDIRNSMENDRAIMNKILNQVTNLNPTRGQWR